MWTQPSPRNLAVTLPVPCTLRQSTVVLRGRKKTKTAPMFSGADCENLGTTGATAWIELESSHTPPDPRLEYVRVHPSTQMSNAWFFTYWRKWPPDPPIGVLARLFVGNRHVGGGLRELQGEVLVGVSQDEDDSEGSFFCLSCTEDETTGELNCVHPALVCPVP